MGCGRVREEYHLTWDVGGTIFSNEMPGDLVLQLALDPHSAVVALTHDLKLDDLILLEALKSADYTGVCRSPLTANPVLATPYLPLTSLESNDILQKVA